MSYYGHFPSIVSGILRRAYQDTLLQNKKVVTRKTYNSIEVDWRVENGVMRQTVSARESLLFIIKGRRPGAKLPVKKTEKGFELVDELAEWVVAVGFGGSHYLLARKIARDGIKGVPITDMALQQIKREIADAAYIHLPGIARNNLRGKIINILR